MDEARIRELIIEAFKTLSETACEREKGYWYEGSYDGARTSLVEFVETVNEAVAALENPEAMPEYLREEKVMVTNDLFSVSMTHREYRVVLAALEAVRDDGERRTRFTGGNKAGTSVFGEVAESLMSRNGNPWDED